MMVASALVRTAYLHRLSIVVLGARLQVSQLCLVTPDGLQDVPKDVTDATALAKEHLTSCALEQKYLITCVFVQRHPTKCACVQA